MSWSRVLPAGVAIVCLGVTTALGIRHWNATTTSPAAPKPYGRLAFTGGLAGEAALTLPKTGFGGCGKNVPAGAHDDLTLSSVGLVIPSDRNFVVALETVGPDGDTYRLVLVVSGYDGPARYDDSEPAFLPPDPNHQKPVVTYNPNRRGAGVYLLDRGPSGHLPWFGGGTIWVNQDELGGRLEATVATSISGGGMTAVQLPQPAQLRGAWSC